jgi:hypothetical protein
LIYFGKPQNLMFDYPLGSDFESDPQLDQAIEILAG